MKRSAYIALSLGLAVFVALLSWRGTGLIADTLAAAGWFGILAISLFHLVPLFLDAAAIHVLGEKRLPFRTSLAARWSGEAVNSLMPAGQMGGPLVMARMLAARLGSMPQAGAIIAVSTTQQVLAQAVFAITGVVLLSLRTGSADLVIPLIGGVALFAVCGLILYRLQRRGLFGRLGRLLSGTAIARNHPALARGAARIDQLIATMYGQTRAVRASFLLNLAGWLAGTGEVWLALHFIGHPVSLMDALLLESLGQAVRGIAFAIPGALGVQEGGFLLLAPFVGLSPEAALALSLCKRARELLLGLPGLAWWHWHERMQRRQSRQADVTGAKGAMGADSTKQKQAATAQVAVPVVTQPGALTVRITPGLSDG